MTQPRATLPVAIGKAAHDLVREVAHNLRTTMRKVVEEAVWNTYPLNLEFTEEQRKKLSQSNPSDVTLHKED